MRAELPSKQVQDYAQKSGWYGKAVFIDGLLDPKNADSGRTLEQLPQILGDTYFASVSYYPISPDDRLAHAFWDCMGETTFKPSGEMLLSAYCSRVSPLRKEDSSLIEILERIKQGDIPITGFPHELFDRWDITVHEPDVAYYEGEEEPVYSGRFRLQNGKLINAGFYSREDSEWIQGWGHPCIDTLLMSPDVNKEGSFLQKEIFAYRNMGDDRYNRLKIGNITLKNVGYLLKAFSEIARGFKNDIYNHVQEEPYDFGTATDAAIALGEAVTQRSSKLRTLPPLK